MPTLPRCRALRHGVALLLMCAAATAMRAAGVVSPLPPELAPAPRVVVLGDSITYAGSYVDYIEAVIRLRDPAWRGEIIDVGLPSETVSGLSEPGHAGGRFPRPDLHERLSRVLGQLHPDLVLACYGMNDGIYLPLAEKRFAAYRDGILWLRQQVIAAGAPIMHLTPPVYDPQAARRGSGKDNPDAEHYDAVLDRYSDWLVAQRAQGWTVLDVHGPMQAELAARRAAEPQFAFAPNDGVHPDHLGHAVMARAILTAWGFPAELANAPMRWATAGEPDWVKLIAKRRKLLSDAWLSQTGHKRPGMAKGEPVEQAEREAADLDLQIRDAMARANVNPSAK